MKSPLNVLSLFLLFIFIGSFSLAQTPRCSTSAGIVSMMWKEYGPWMPNVSLPVWTTQANQSISNWNQEASSKFAIAGPRSLKLPNGTSTGTVFGQNNRTFVLPPSFKNTVAITLKKIDGKAPLGVTICTTAYQGGPQTFRSFTFEKGDQTTTQTFTIPNAKGKVISVCMRNYSMGDKFKYTISVK